MFKSVKRSLTVDWLQSSFIRITHICFAVFIQIIYSFIRLLPSPTICAVLQGMELRCAKMLSCNYWIVITSFSFAQVKYSRLFCAILESELLTTWQRAQVSSLPRWVNRKSLSKVFLYHPFVRLLCPTLQRTPQCPIYSCQVPLLQP